jgi:hypothetical protein
MRAITTPAKTSTQARLRRAAIAMVDAVSMTATGEPGAAAKRAKFKKLAIGIEQRTLVRHGAELLSDGVISADEAEEMLWGRLRQFLGWVDLACYPPEGSA